MDRANLGTYNRLMAGGNRADDSGPRAADDLLPLALSRPREALVKARAVLAGQPGAYEASVAHQAAAIVTREFGDVEAGVRELRMALRLARQARSAEREADVLATLGVAFVYAGRTADGMAAFDQAIHQSGGVVLARVLVRRGIAHLALGDYQAALEYWKNASDELERAGDLLYVARVLNGRALVDLAMGRTKEADSGFVSAGRLFSEIGQELEAAYNVLGGYAGFHTTTPPVSASAYGVYWPALVPASVVTQTVHLPDGTSRIVPHTVGSRDATAAFPAGAPATPADGVPGDAEDGRAAPLVEIPLGRLCGARSGDKGADANVGLWAVNPRAYAWLRRHLTTARFRELLTEAASLDIDRYELPNLLALNFVVHGLLAPGVSATARPDPQAKGLGEYLRSRIVTVPADLLG